MGLARNFTAEGDVAQNRVMRLGSQDGHALQAASGDDPIIGVSGIADAKAGERVDVYLSGVHDLKLGGAVTRGDWLTADGDGRGVPATGGADAVGRALESGVAGDLIPVVITLGPNIT